ncbi:MAG TPA: VWA domain-containing protein [Burkholderiales bacterium]|jgi:hypothetical protein
MPLQTLLDAAPPVAQPGGKLAENVVHFARVLRAAGMQVGPAKVLDALQALQIAGIESRADWHAVLKAIFVQRHEDSDLFDQAFEFFWRDPALLERMMQLLLPKVYGRAGNADEEQANRRLADALTPPHAPKREKQQEKIEVEAELTFSAAEKLQRVDFEKMSAAEWQQAKEAIARLRLPLPQIRTRRRAPHARGEFIDPRATARASLRSGGEILRLKRTRRVKRTPPLVVLCDISGSMHRYTRMLLHFVHALARHQGAQRVPVHTLLFGTRLTNVTRHLRERDVDVAVERVRNAVADWAGGTRIGASLAEFNLHWSRRLLGQNASVLLITDGLDRDQVDELRAAMAKLKRSAHQLIWLNPLLRYDKFEARPAGIRAMLPYVDAHLPVHNLESLRGLAEALARAQWQNAG